jgi:hypothetical protein
MADRYIIFGVITSEHEDDNSDTPDEQRVGNTIPIYRTDNKEEALTIIREGGFIRGDKWSAAQWAFDTETHATVGNVPEGYDLEEIA